MYWSGNTVKYCNQGLLYTKWGPGKTQTILPLDILFKTYNFERIFLTGSQDSDSWKKSFLILQNYGQVLHIWILRLLEI